MVGGSVRMAYAVAMTTINRFERALGRKALWSDRCEMATANSELDANGQGRHRRQRVATAVGDAVRRRSS